MAHLGFLDLAAAGSRKLTPVVDQAARHSPVAGLHALAMLLSVGLACLPKRLGALPSLGYPFAALSGQFGLVLLQTARNAPAAGCNP
ncbi:MAG: hypothetical protein ACREDU_06745, partial [Methylocella sp.]